MTNHPEGFYGLGIAPAILEVLNKLEFHTPTPIQQRSIPVALEGKDLMGIAQTGTGKTLAFGIPMIQHVLQGNGYGLVVLPTRELAIQVFETLDKIGRSQGLRCALLIGGEAMGRQLAAIRRGPHIVIATPGRLIDHLDQKTVNLQGVNMLVLDEADRMLDMGFAPQLKRILQSVPKERQTMLFSATMPEDIVGIARQYMKLPTRVEIAPPGKVADRVTQELFFVSKPDKPRLLEKTLTEYRGSTLVFIRTKHGAKKLARQIRDMGHTAAELHANRSLSQRREALDGFKSGKYRVLVATDIAARGIDVQGIELVVNFDLPSTAEDYVHRIGRTGRASATGHAISFATPDQKKDVFDIERLIKMTLRQSQLPSDLPAAQPEPPREPRQFAPRGRGGFSGGRGGGSRGHAPSRDRRPGPAPRPAAPAAPREFNPNQPPTSLDFGYNPRQKLAPPPHPGFGRRGGGGRGGPGQGRFRPRPSR